MAVDDTIVSSDDEASVRLDNTTGLHRGRAFGPGGGATFLGGASSGADSKSFGTPLRFSIPHDDLVIISRSDNVLVILSAETPSLSIAMSVHNFLAIVTLTNVIDGALLSGHEHGSIEAINRADHGSEG